MTNNDGGPAYHWREEDGQGGFVDHPGMTLRDWMAGMALTGSRAEAPPSVIASSCYAIADAMLAVREGK